MADELAATLGAFAARLERLERRRGLGRIVAMARGTPGQTGVTTLTDCLNVTASWTNPDPTRLYIAHGFLRLTMDSGGGTQVVFITNQSNTAFTDGESRHTPSSVGNVATHQVWAYPQVLAVGARNDKMRFQSTAPCSTLATAYLVIFDAGMGP